MVPIIIVDGFKNFALLTKKYISMLRFGFKNFQVRNLRLYSPQECSPNKTNTHDQHSKWCERCVDTLIPDMSFILFVLSAKSYNSLLPRKEEKKLSTNKITNLALALLCLATL
jgi:hypothetical protein